MLERERSAKSIRSLEPEEAPLALAPFAAGAALVSPQSIMSSADVFAFELCDGGCGGCGEENEDLPIGARGWLGIVFGTEEDLGCAAVLGEEREYSNN